MQKNQKNINKIILLKENFKKINLLNNLKKPYLLAVGPFILFKPVKIIVKDTILIKPPNANNDLKNNHLNNLKKKSEIFNINEKFYEENFQNKNLTNIGSNIYDKNNLNKDNLLVGSLNKKLKNEFNPASYTHPSIVVVTYAPKSDNYYAANLHFSSINSDHPVALDPLNINSKTSYLMQIGQLRLLKTEEIKLYTENKMLSHNKNYEELSSEVQTHLNKSGTPELGQYFDNNNTNILFLDIEYIKNAAKENPKLDIIPISSALNIRQSTFNDEVFTPEDCKYLFLSLTSLRNEISEKDLKYAIKIQKNRINKGIDEHSDPTLDTHPKINSFTKFREVLNLQEKILETPTSERKTTDIGNQVLTKIHSPQQKKSIQKAENINIKKPNGGECDV